MRKRLQNPDLLTELLNDVVYGKQCAGAALNSVDER